MHPLLEGALFAGALPAALSAGLLAGSLALSKSGTACRWRGGIVVGLPFFVSGLALGTSGGALDWLPYLALAAALHPRLVSRGLSEPPRPVFKGALRAPSPSQRSCSGSPQGAAGAGSEAARAHPNGPQAPGWEKRKAVAFGLRLLFAVAGCAILAQNKLRFAWEWAEALYTVGGLSLAWFAFATAVHTLPDRSRGESPRGELPALLGISAALGASAPIWGIAGSLSLAQASGALAAIGSVLAVFVWLRPTAEIPRATLPALTYLWGGIVVAGCLLVYELSPWVPLGFALVPVVALPLWHPRVRRLPLWGLCVLAVLACTAPVLGVVGILSAPEPEAEVEEEDPYAGYEDWTPSGE